MASHNDLQDRGHISAFPDQAAITAFLRGLLGKGRTQVTWASVSGIPYNTLTNWFTKKPPLMSAEAFLALVMSANAEDRLVKQIQDWRASSGEVSAASGLALTSAEGATAARIATTYQAAEKQPPKKSGKKPRAKRRA